jgi:heme exporter protein D
MTLVAGLFSAYLMNRERMKFEDDSGFFVVGVTGWFWLGFGTSILMIIMTVFRLLRLRRADE